MTNYRARNCLACKKELAPAFNDVDHYQPYDGLIFTASGNYGSTIYDPIMDAGVLEIIVCDKCVIAASEAGLVAKVEKKVKTTFESKPWNRTAEV